MNSNRILSGQSFLPHENPQKLIFMLHGYGDTAENFIHIANFLDQPELEANYFALNAPSIISEYSLGRQWFDLYPNGIYIANAGIDEIKIIQSDILTTSKLLENTVNQIISPVAGAITINLRFIKLAFAYAHIISSAALP